MTASVVDWAAMWQVVWVSTVAGCVLTAAFSTAILGASRATTARREGHTTAATLYGALAALTGVGVVVGVVVGVTVMLSKG